MSSSFSQLLLVHLLLFCSELLGTLTTRMDLYLYLDRICPVEKTLQITMYVDELRKELLKGIRSTAKVCLSSCWNKDNRTRNISQLEESNSDKWKMNNLMVDDDGKSFC